MLCSYSPNLAATASAELLADLQRHVVKLISLVDIHHDTVLADLQRFAQGRHLLGRTHAVRRTQEAALNRIIGDVAHTSPPGSGPVDGMVVAEHQHAVLRQFEVQLHDIDAHADHRLDGGNRILRIVAPVSAVRSHHDVFRRGIVNLGHDFRRMRRVFRSGGFRSGASPQQCGDGQNTADKSLHKSLCNLVYRSIK